MIYRVPEAVANSTFANECPYEGRQRLFFGVGGSGRRPFGSADPGGGRGVRGCRKARYSNYTVLEGIGARGLRGGWCTNGYKRVCNPLHRVVKNPCLVHAEPQAPLPDANYSNPYPFLRCTGSSWCPRMVFGGSKTHFMEFETEAFECVPDKLRI